MTDVQEEPPTADQLGSILSYLGPSKAGTVVEQASGTSDALKKFKASQTAFQRPVTVDWNNGRAGKFFPRPLSCEPRQAAEKAIRCV